LLRAWQRVGAANERIADCWEWADWPELMRVEERTVEGDETNGYYIPYEQSGETAMGEVFSVLRDNPATHVAPRAIGYTLLGDNVRFPQSTDLPDTVWVNYRIRPIDVPARVTAIGMTAALLENTYPAVIAKAVGLMLTSDLLAEDGQMDKALAMEQMAEAELISQRDKYYFQQGQPSTWTARVNQY
jgi:hypothetical protein